jgi:hypothetical protein
MSRVPRRAILERRLENLRARAARGETRIEASDVERAQPLEVTEPSPSAAADPPPVAPALAPPLAEPIRSEPPVLAIVGFTIASAGLVTFAVAGGITLAEDARLRDECAPSCAGDAVDTITASAIASDVGLGVALAGAVLGVIGLVIGGGRETPREGTVRLRGLGVEGSF